MAPPLLDKHWSGQDGFSYFEKHKMLGYFSFSFIKFSPNLNLYLSNPKPGLPSSHQDPPTAPAPISDAGTEIVSDLAANKAFQPSVSQNHFLVCV